MADDLTIFIINVEALSTARGWDFASSFFLRNQLHVPG